MTVKVSIALPAGQIFQAQVVYVDRHNGRTVETVITNELEPGKSLDVYPTSTRTVEIREVTPLFRS